MLIRCMHCMKEYDDSQESCPECGFVRGTPPKEIYHLFPEVELAKRYIIGTVVAYGGFGILYRAWDSKLQIMVAVKEYFPSSYVNRNPGEQEIFIYTSKKRGEFQDGLEGFLDEARNTAKFSSHPNIVNVYDYFKENGTAYMVMEFMEGKTLKQYTKEKGGALEWKEAVDFLTSICDDLHVVHEAGILHRDISPDNIMLCSDESIKLFDFGAARFSDVEKDVTRTIILKIGFAPPEQYRAKSKQGPWTDVYALGATLYRTITGQLPDESVNRQEAILREGKDTLLKPSFYVSDIPEYLDIAICRAMAIQPELRFKDVQQFKDAILNRRQYSDVEEELKKRKKRRKIEISMLGAVLLAGAAGCFTYYKNRQLDTNLYGADVSIWASVREGESEETKKEMLELMTAEFSEDYPDVKVEIRCISEEQYELALAEAAKTGTFPTLYECPSEAGFLERRDNLDETLKLLDLDSYYYLDEQHLGADCRELPLGWHLPVIYKNSLLQEISDDVGDGTDVDRFLAGTTPYLISDTSMYETVQTALPGIYDVEQLEKDILEAGFDELWAVDGQAKELDRKAAKRILYYFLGETAQDILHVQNAHALPLNRNELQAYLETNQELSFLQEQLDSEVSVEFQKREKTGTNGGDIGE